MLERSAEELEYQQMGIPQGAVTFAYHAASQGPMQEDNITFPSAIVQSL